jgi:hypothetical protein
MKDVCHRNATTKGGGHHGGAHGPSRRLDVENEAVMVNFQVDYFSQEGACESHWANGCSLLPYFQTNRRPEVAGAVRLGEGRRHKLDKVILDLDVVADALEGEELKKSSGGSYSKDESALPHELGTAQRKEGSIPGLGLGTKLMEPCGWGPLGKNTVHQTLAIVIEIADL